MKVKTYTALSVADAMDQIRKDWGKEALILSNQHVTGGVRVTIAVEEKQSDAEIEEALYGPMEEQDLQRIRAALDYHRVPDVLVERILMTASTIDEKDPVLRLGQTLTQLFKFAPLPDKSAKRAFMLVGSNGSGKTIGVAKMAVKAKIAGKKVGAVTADMRRAGAVEQLAAFMKILEIDLIKIRKAELLKEAVDGLRLTCDLIVIDSPGINPFAPDEMALLTALRQDVDGLEPVLVMTSGLDAFEASDIAEAFAGIGCKRMMATRLDLSRRFGSILFAAYNNGLALCDAGVSPHVSQGLFPLDGNNLAAMMLSFDKGAVR